MKKSNIAIIIVCAAVLLLSSIFAVKYLSDKKSTVDEAENTTAVSSEKKEKGRAMKNAVRIIEGKNFSLSADSAEEDEVGEDSFNYLFSSIFDRVFIKTKALSSSGQGFSAAERDKLESLLKRLQKNKKEVFLELDVSNDGIDFESVAKLQNVDGILLSGTKELNAEQLSVVTGAAKNLFEGKKVFLEVPFGFEEFEKLDFENKSPDSLLIVLSGKSTQENEEFLKKADAFCKEKKLSTACGIRFDVSESEKSNAMLPLENTVLSDSFSSVKSRLFLNLGGVQSDVQNCFGAVKEYLSVGIDKALAFRTLSVDGYSKGDTVVTSEHKTSLIVRTSNLFPFFLDGEEIEPSKDGTATVDLSLKNGKNKFTFSQCGKELEYEVTVNFDDEVIREIKPVSVIYASPGKKLKLTVTAVSGAAVTAKAGTSRFEPKRTTREKEGYCDYIFEITAPKSKVEIESLGKLTVSADYKDKTYTKEGPSIIYVDGGEIEASTPIGETTTKKNNRVTIGNNVGTSMGEAQTSQSATSAPSTTAQPYTGNQMCIVTSDYADTWPPATNDDSFVPYYTPLVKGTIDYVTGQSQLYDSEEGITRDFYSLASGRRVLTKDVRLVSYVNQGENRISVASCDERNGDLEVKLSMNWEVPYSFSFGPQAYYSANSKRFNVNSFTARYIQFTFYYTSAASGSVDTSKSDIVSAASWSADSTQNTVSLTLELKDEGKYYGYSITRGSDGKLVLTLKGKPKTLSGTLVVLDPGHGGSDVGATGLSGSAYESRMNFALAVATKNELEKRGAKVLMTRTGDSDITLEERKTFARQNNAELFVSIHCNASVNTSKYGTSVYYYRPFSQPLANAIYEKMRSLFQNDFYASNSERRSACAIGTLYNPFSVTRLEECPSVLVETAFITNETECRLLLDSGNRDKIAAAISDGIESYLSS